MRGRTENQRGKTEIPACRDGSDDKWKEKRQTSSRNVKHKFSFCNDWNHKRELLLCVIKTEFCKLSTFTFEPLNLLWNEFSPDQQQIKLSQTESYISLIRVCLSRVAVEVVSTKTTADVMWKDGRVEKGIRSNDLIPIQHLDSHEFCPGDFVVDKRRKENIFNSIYS